MCQMFQAHSQFPAQVQDLKPVLRGLHTVAVCFTLKQAERFAFQGKKFEAGMVWVLLQLLCSINSCKEKCLAWFRTLFLSLDYSFWILFSVKLLEKNENRCGNELPGKTTFFSFTEAFLLKVFTWMCIKQNSSKPHFSHPFQQFFYSVILFSVYEFRAKTGPFSIRLFLFLKISFL